MADLQSYKAWAEAKIGFLIQKLREGEQRKREEAAKAAADVLQLRKVRRPYRACKQAGMCKALLFVMETCRAGHVTVCLLAQEHESGSSQSVQELSFAIHICEQQQWLPAVCCVCFD